MEKPQFSYIGGIVHEVLSERVGGLYATEKCQRFIAEDGQPLGRGDSLFEAVQFLDRDNLKAVLIKLGVKETEVRACAEMLQRLLPLI